jgi:hypothetical protein
MNKPNLTPSLRALGVAVVLGGLAWWSAGCTVEEHGPYRAGVYYDYDYYPDANVYFYPEGRIYYWYHDGRWKSGPVLPDRYVIREERREHLHLRSREPWREHHGAGREEHGEERGEHYGEMGHHQE